LFEPVTCFAELEDFFFYEMEPGQEPFMSKKNLFGGVHLENLDSMCCIPSGLCCDYNELIIVAGSFAFFFFLLYGYVHP
jgi:hypothetical protein